MVEETEDFINDLLKRPFSNRKLSEKLEIIKRGRPTPLLPFLNLSANKLSTSTRHVHISYGKTEWLTGSPTKSKLYCWPCLLFSTDRTNIWAKGGFNNFKAISTGITKHEKSIIHIRSSLNLKNYKRNQYERDTNTNALISESIPEHNKNVDENKEILKKLIDCICFLAKQETPFSFCGINPWNGKNLTELLNLIKSYENILGYNLKSVNMFKEEKLLSIQNDLFNSFSCVLTEAIKQEIKKSEFVSIIYDESFSTEDENSSKQISSTLIRFLNDKDQLQERFLCFKDFKDENLVNSLHDHTLNVITSLDLEDKFIGESYEGNRINSFQVKDLQKKLLEKLSNSVSIHNHNYNPILFLQHSVLSINECKDFFHVINGIFNFFSKSLKIFEDFVQHKKKLIVGELDFRINLINTIKNNREILIDFFEFLLERSDNWNLTFVSQFRSTISHLKRIDCKFFLEIYSQFFNRILIFSHALNLQNSNSLFNSKNYEEIENLKKNLNWIEILKISEFNEIWSNINNYENLTNSNTNKKSSFLKDKNQIEKYKILYKKISDSILIYVNERCKYLDSLNFAHLLNTNNFQNFRKTFPILIFDEFTKIYGNFFNLTKLKDELLILYANEEFCYKNLSQLLEFMKCTHVDAIMTEVIKLGKLILTLPFVIPDSTNRSIIDGKIKSYYQFRKGQNNLNTLALLSIENDLLTVLEKETDFYDRVIENFIRKSGLEEFVYKLPPNS